MGYKTLDSSEYIGLREEVKRVSDSSEYIGLREEVKRVSENQKGEALRFILLAVADLARHAWMKRLRAWIQRL